MGFDLEDLLLSAYVDYDYVTEKKSFNGNMRRYANGYISDSLNGIEVVRGSHSAEVGFAGGQVFVVARLARIHVGIVPTNSIIDIKADFSAFENYTLASTGVSHPFGFRNTVNSSFVKNSLGVTSQIGTVGGTHSMVSTNFTYTMVAPGNPWDGKQADTRIFLDGSYICLDVITPKYVTTNFDIQQSGNSNLTWQVNYEYTILTGSNRVITEE